MLLFWCDSWCLTWLCIIDTAEWATFPCMALWFCWLEDQTFIILSPKRSASYTAFKVPAPQGLRFPRMTKTVEPYTTILMHTLWVCWQVKILTYSTRYSPGKEEKGEMFIWYSSFRKNECCFIMGQGNLISGAVRGMHRPLNPMPWHVHFGEAIFMLQV